MAGTNPPPSQRRPQPLPCAPDPALDRPHRTTQLASDLGVTAAGEARQHQRLAITGRQPIDRLVERPPQLAQARRVGRLWLTARERNPVERLFACHAAADGLGGPGGNAVQPCGHGRAAADARRAPGQRQKRGLKGVLGCVGVAESAATGAENQWPMPPDEQLERRLVAANGEPLK
ncbi:MAG: hypothetical protein U0746_03605 [Gemmataceae bacterium]